MIIQLIIIIISLFILGILILKYLNGSFTYKDEIIKEGIVENSVGRIKGYFYIIQRTYESGKIKIFKQDIKSEIGHNM